MSAAAARSSPAGFWKRYLAWSIDALLISVVAQFLFGIVATVFAFGGDDMLKQLTAASATMEGGGDTDALMALVQSLTPLLWQMTWLSTLLYMLCATIYFVGMEASPWQATLGKRLLGIRVVDMQGRRIGLWPALLRCVVAGISWLLLNLGHAMAAWTADKRALHDYAAGTRVENIDPANTAIPRWGWLLLAAQGLAMLAFVLIGGLVLGLVFSSYGVV
ncbi:MAG TPA: RDD family protein [Arenimonas sp.]|uniref:RDD family protein n=1 Tax=Arenimonas sp. TaxID=1872635 RepID=UPI002C97AA10|nr:RDD family protein [Arenimonas sp.]HMB57298.1 RDD family protein [Arenimonas sp.]